MLATVAAMQSTWSTQPWSSVPIHCYEGGTSTNNLLSSSDPSYAAWKTTLTSALRDIRMAYAYQDPNGHLSGNPGYCQALKALGVTFNQLTLIQAAVEVQDSSGFGSMEIITQMEGIPPNSNAPKWAGLVAFSAGVSP